MLVCAGLVGGVYWYRSRRAVTPRAMMACLPRTEATLVYIDVGALRASHILDLIAGSKAAADLEYQQFVDQSGFDYRSDLDAVAAAFTHRGVFMVLRGRFNWKSLIAYARIEGGDCHNSFCRVPSSTAGKFISYFPLTPSSMALAIDSDEWAATQIKLGWSSAVAPLYPTEPVWVSVPAAFLRNASDLPAGTKSFASALSTAQRIVFAIGPQRGHLEVHLDVTCSTSRAASDLAAELERTTDLLRKMLERDNQKANPRDLSGVLVAGSFRAQDTRVLGTWPLQREFIEAVAGGSLN